jgi:hypothetical protein
MAVRRDIAGDGPIHVLPDREGDFAVALHLGGGDVVVGESFRSFHRCRDRVRELRHSGDYIVVDRSVPEVVR